MHLVSIFCWILLCTGVRGRFVDVSTRNDLPKEYKKFLDIDGSTPVVFGEGSLLIRQFDEMTLSFKRSECHNLFYTIGRASLGYFGSHLDRASEEVTVRISKEGQVSSSSGLPARDMPHLYGDSTGYMKLDFMLRGRSCRTRIEGVQVIWETPEIEQFADRTAILGTRNLYIFVGVTGGYMLLFLSSLLGLCTVAKGNKKLLDKKGHTVVLVGEAKSREVKGSTLNNNNSVKASSKSKSKSESKKVKTSKASKTSKESKRSATSKTVA